MSHRLKGGSAPTFSFGSQVGVANLVCIYIFMAASHVGSTSMSPLAEAEVEESVEAALGAEDAEVASEQNASEAPEATQPILELLLEQFKVEVPPSGLPNGFEELLDKCAVRSSGAAGLVPVVQHFGALWCDVGSALPPFARVEESTRKGSWLVGHGLEALTSFQSKSAARQAASERSEALWTYLSELLGDVLLAHCDVEALKESCLAMALEHPAAPLTSTSRSAPEYAERDSNARFSDSASDDLQVLADSAPDDLLTLPKVPGFAVLEQPLASAGASVSAKPTWRPYMHEGRMWWWCSDEERWFFVDDADSGWTRYDHQGRMWWWHSATGDFFFEDEYGSNGSELSAWDDFWLGNGDDSGGPSDRVASHWIGDQRPQPISGNDLCVEWRVVFQSAHRTHLPSLDVCVIREGAEDARSDV